MTDRSSHYQIGMCSKVTIEFSNGQIIELNNPNVSLELSVEEIQNTSIYGETSMVRGNSTYEVSVDAVVSEDKRAEIDQKFVRLIRGE